MTSNQSPLNTPQPGVVPVSGMADGTRVAMAKVDGFIHMTFPAGKADGTAVRELYEATAQLLDHHHIQVVVDLGGVDFVSSGMMGMLVTAKKKIASVGGAFHVVIANPLIHQSFTAMRLDRMIPLHATLQEAASALGR